MKIFVFLFKGLMCNISSTGVTRRPAGRTTECSMTLASSLRPWWHVCLLKSMSWPKEGLQWRGGSCVAPSHLTRTPFAIRLLAFRPCRILHTGPLSLRTVGCACPVGWDVTYVRRDESHRPHQPWRDMYLRVCNKIRCACFTEASLECAAKRELAAGVTSISQLWTTEEETGDTALLIWSCLNSL